MRCFLLLVIISFSGCTGAQVPGCTDPLAVNYNAQAVINDGSCTYAITNVTPYQSLKLGDTLPETSGLIWYDQHIWTHNDDTDDSLYALDTATAYITRKVTVANTYNKDWEEITQNDDYIYIGDFGNNGNGNRQDLHILRIAKADMNNSMVIPDTIRFRYIDQPTPVPAGPNNTDFDCEAFVATTDSLYLFSKQWLSKKSRLYALPNTPGDYTAIIKDEYDVQGMITGATYAPDRRLVGLVGYNINGNVLTPFLYLLYDFKGTDFFGGNKRKLGLNVPLHQTEGITTTDGRKFFVSNEMYANSLITIDAKLHKLDLSPYLDTYYRSLAVNDLLNKETLIISPNPTSDRLQVDLSAKKAVTGNFLIKNMEGKILATRQIELKAGQNKINIKLPSMVPGTYWLHIEANRQSMQQRFVYNSR